MSDTCNNGENGDINQFDFNESDVVQYNTNRNERLEEFYLSVIEHSEQENFPITISENLILYKSKIGFIIPMPELNVSGSQLNMLINSIYKDWNNINSLN